MGSYAFYGCNVSVEELVIPDGVKTIGKYAYARNYARKLLLPASVDKIASQAFYWLHRIEEIQVEPANAS